MEKFDIHSVTQEILKPKFPEVTERKYYKWRYHGDQFFTQLGWTISKYGSYEYKTLKVHKPKTLVHETHLDCFVLIGDDWNYSCSIINQSVEKKHLCIGGPLAGQLLACSQAPDYLVFNSAVGARQNKGGVNTVLIHNELLKK